MTLGEEQGARGEEQGVCQATAYASCQYGIVNTSTQHK